MIRMSMTGQKIKNLVVSAFLCAALFGMIVAIVFILVTHKTETRFTEFYILGSHGQAFDFPSQLYVGEDGTIMVGIVNHEGKLVSYSVELSLNGIESSETTLVLANGDKWEKQINFAPSEIGQNLLELNLYKDDGTIPCVAPLYLWLTVTKP